MTEIQQALLDTSDLTPKQKEAVSVLLKEAAREGAWVWREALVALVSAEPLGDFIYAVRSSESEGGGWEGPSWEGPRVVRFGNAVTAAESLARCAGWDGKWHRPQY